MNYRQKNRIFLALELKGVSMSLFDRNIQSGRFNINIEWELMKIFKSNKIADLINDIIAYRSSPSHNKANLDSNILLEKNWINKTSIKTANRIFKIISKTI